MSGKSICIDLQGISDRAVHCRRSGDNVTFLMTKSLDPFRFLLITVSGWMNQHQLQLIDYLREENRVLREQLGGKRLRFNDDQRRRLAAKAKGLGLLQEVATMVTPETLLAWHRRLIAQKIRRQPPAGTRPTEKASGDRGSGSANGKRKPRLGLSTHPGSAVQSGSSGGPGHDRRDVSPAWD